MSDKRYDEERHERGAIFAMSETSQDSCDSNEERSERTATRARSDRSQERDASYQNTSSQNELMVSRGCDSISIAD